MTIRFRDRPLRGEEKSNYYCDECGMDVLSDFRNHHRCPGKIKMPPF